jgi:hypothetical protein
MVLGTGAILGAALDRKVQARSSEAASYGSDRGRSGSDPRSRGFDPRGRDRSRSPEEQGDSSQRRPRLIVDQVGLSEDQNEQVDSIVRYFMEEMRALHEEFDREYSTRYREINQASRDAVRAVLGPDQRAAYDSLLAEWDQRRRDRTADSTSARDGVGSNER